ncbi:alpha/beta fold hydrolase [Ferruginibacter sp.]
MLHKNISLQSANIFYRVAGSGQPVVLLHGFGEDGDVWDKQVDVLKNNYTLIVPDLPGSGRSGMIDDMSMEGMAGLVKELIDTAIPAGQKIILIGHSMGGYISLAFAQKYGSSLSGLGLFHSSAFADSEEKKATRLKAIDFIKKNGSYDFLRTSVPGLFVKTQNNAGPLPGEVQGLIDKVAQFDPEALIRYYHTMIARPDRTELLKNFPHPVLFIIGEQDKAVPFAQSMQQSYLPAVAHIHILRNSAHMGMWEETEKANKALLDFLQG